MILVHHSSFLTFFFNLSCSTSSVPLSPKSLLTKIKKKFLTLHIFFKEFLSLTLNFFSFFSLHLCTFLISLPLNNDYPGFQCPFSSHSLPSVSHINRNSYVPLRDWFQDSVGNQNPQMLKSLT